MENQDLEIELLNSQIEIWQNNIDQLTAKINDFSDVKNTQKYLELVSEIEELRSLINVEKLKIEDLKNHDYATWQTIQEGVKASWELLKMKIEDTLERLTHK